MNGGIVEFNRHGPESKYPAWKKENEGSLSHLLRRFSEMMPSEIFIESAFGKALLDDVSPHPAPFSSRGPRIVIPVPVNGMAGNGWVEDKDQIINVRSLRNGVVVGRLAPFIEDGLLERPVEYRARSIHYAMLSAIADYRERLEEIEGAITGLEDMFAQDKLVKAAEVAARRINIIKFACLGIVDDEKQARSVTNAVVVPEGYNHVSSMASLIELDYRIYPKGPAKLFINAFEFVRGSLKFANESIQGTTSLLLGEGQAVISINP